MGAQRSISLLPPTTTSCGGASLFKDRPALYPAGEVAPASGLEALCGTREVAFCLAARVSGALGRREKSNRRRGG